LQTLGTLLHLEFHLRAFIQRTVAVRLNRRKMDEYIVTAGPLDETIAFCGIEPLYDAFFLHLHFS